MTVESTGTVVRAMAVMTALAEADQDVALKDLVRVLGLPQSTCHRLLDLLSQAGFVERDKRLHRYRIGVNFLRLASLVASRTDLATLARPTMERLTADTGETSVLAVYDRASHAVFFAATVDAPHPLRYRIRLFEPTSPAWGASGRAVAAWLSENEVERIYEGSKSAPASGSHWKSLGDFRGELERVRAQGFAVTRSEKLSGAVGVGAPILGADGTPLGSLSLTIPEQRVAEVDIERLAGWVRAAADELSHLQGFRRRQGDVHD